MADSEACHATSGHGQQLRPLTQARIFRYRATAGESATKWWLERARRIAGERRRPASLPELEARRGFNERARIGMLRITHRPDRITDFDDTPEIHHGDAIGYMPYYTKIMADE